MHVNKSAFVEVDAKCRGNQKQWQCFVADDDFFIPVMALNLNMVYLCFTHSQLAPYTNIAVLKCLIFKH